MPGEGANQKCCVFAERKFGDVMTNAVSGNVNFRRLWKGEFSHAVFNRDLRGGNGTEKNGIFGVQNGFPPFRSQLLAVSQEKEKFTGIDEEIHLWDVTGCAW